ncbi:MAG: hypothetical protein A2504_17285 [Bdellovibrionales bacterium RIFOXYD12_FULL_39_22]|nr:MAG: hypothetical protein A2385_10675 [Bdellovibrionales bacterium RIFOXYB1_FULL_39_21]OFZ40759.1 MAG: hypothetical protein A2485_17055 [Bdellovibrionales bacterium RIFOXYC12_FULL_39_17]OFZ48181.1 MAG: hypothetical protein A2404_17215 [Bdellovibrionales bacterium RIFOXYC1_FULL_39_130]OFZ75831.1 MAG: hypothetical protein A2560_13715 [Bdellovibrionales bacterium RIFOXYD1_FULL_39_84]OFZ91892.1 MAG: hypothetical protein A2504_17285 [Bdellovibrionales bacterium RIFOXYD12_FULL_39_22]HLE11402.1 po
MKTLIKKYSYFLKLSLLVLLLTFTNEGQGQLPDDEKNYVSNTDVGMGKYLTKSLKKTRKVVLTFDDGPHEKITEQVLDILYRYNAPATFFVLGKKITPETTPLLERIVRDGHTLASHGYGHDEANKQTEITFKNELYNSFRQIDDIYGNNSRASYYRFPYGAYGFSPDYHHLNALREISHKLYQQNCINFVFWDIDSQDWSPLLSADQNAQNIISNIDGGTYYNPKKTTNFYGKREWIIEKYPIKNPIGGGIVLMHDIRSKTVEILELFLDYAARNNIEIIPLDDMKEANEYHRFCK